MEINDFVRSTKYKFGILFTSFTNIMQTYLVVNYNLFTLIYFKLSNSFDHCVICNLETKNIFYLFIY